MSDALNDLEKFDEEIKILGIKLITNPELNLIKELHRKDQKWILQVGEKVRGLRQAASHSLNFDASGYGKLIWDSLIQYYIAGPMLAVIMYGPNACVRLSELVGAFNPAHAAPGTMRAKYGHDSFRQAAIESRAVQNGIYFSNDPFDGLVDTKLFFPELSLPDLIK